MTLPVYAMSQASFPKIYEELIVPSLFRPWVDDLFERAKLARGDRVLDVACGTGIVARVARQRLGADAHIVGVDVSAPMLAVASEQDPTIDWREGDAAALPVGGLERFDVVFCQQGLQFFSDKPAALREMKRVLAPSGRVAIACWCSVEEMPVFHELQRIAERHLGPIADQRYSFGDATALADLLRKAGFLDVDVRKATRTVRFHDGLMFLHLNAMALIGMSTVGARLSDEGRMQMVDVIERESMPVIERFNTDDGIAFETATNIGTAHV